MTFVYSTVSVQWEPRARRAPSAGGQRTPELGSHDGQGEGAAPLLDPKYLENGDDIVAISVLPLVAGTGPCVLQELGDVP